jgi:hypothetical protein
MNTQKELNICIPRVYSNTDKKYIKNVFEKIIGVSSNIQIIFVNIKNDEQFKRVFVNIKYNSTNNLTNNSTNNKINNLCKRLENNQQLKIVYSDPLFWRCSLSTTKPYYNKN